MTEMPWLRLYNEILSDRKIGRICRETQQPKALIIGVWATMLTLASISPQRGYLLISDDFALSTDEIMEETGLDKETFDKIVKAFTNYGMIAYEGDCWMICNWDRRQPASDNSAERVRRFRQRQKEETVTADTPHDEALPPPDSETLQGENDVTLRNSYSNLLDKEEETEQEKEEDTPLPPTGGSGGEIPQEKSKGGRPPKVKPETIPIPRTLDSPEFRQRWGEWLKHRIEIRHPATATAAEKQLKLLEGIGLRRAIVAIDHSIANGWQGIFEPKASQNGHGRPQAKRAADNPESVANDPDYNPAY